MKPTRTRPMHRRTGLRLILIALPLVMLSIATNASAQVCASLTLTTQPEVDAVSCSSITGVLGLPEADNPSAPYRSPLTMMAAKSSFLSPSKSGHPRASRNPGAIQSYRYC